MTVGDCCYWYTQFPATPSVCERSTMVSTVNLVCEVQYLLSDNITNINVNWYRSMREDTAGMDGERVTGMTNKVNSRTSSNITTKQFMLEIRNFSATSDTGYYWCQLVVNNVSLSASPYGYIYSTNFALQDYTYNTNDQPICAQNTTSNLTMLAQSNEKNCTSDNSSTTTDAGIAITATTQTDGAHTITIKPNVENYCEFTESGYPCVIGIIAGALPLVITLVLLLSILVLLYKKKSGE